MSNTNTISKTRDLIELGTFEIVSGKVRISDPCYDKKTWCAGSISNVLNGTWKAQVIKKVETYTYNSNEDWCKGKEFNDRRNILITVHESFDKLIHIDKRKIKIDGGMDAGMAGIFDDKFYKKNYKEDYIMFGNEEYNNNQRNFHKKNSGDLYKAMARMKGEVYKEPSQEELDAEELKISLMILEMEIARLPESIKSNKDRKGFEEFAVRDAKRLKEAKTRLARYKADPRPENLIERTRDWYEICCDKSLSNIGAGVIRNGVVSSSGYGDGGYTTYAIYNSDGKVVGIKLIF